MRKVIIRSGQTIFKKVRLPFPGTVVARTGQKVSQGDVLAEARLPEKFQIFDVVNHLSIQPNRLDEYLKRLNGEKVSKGDVIAQKPGLITRIFRASQEGKIVSLREGRVTLAMGERVIAARSPIEGTVVELIPRFGAVVSLSGSLIQGVWGNGLNAKGVFVRLEFDFTDPQQRGNFPDVAGKIVYSDALLSPDRFDVLASKKPAGIVMPSLMPALVSVALESPVAVMSLSGFGDQVIDPVCSSMLDTMQGQEVYLLPDEQTGVVELILPGEAKQSNALFDGVATLRVGSLVRFLGEPYLGNTGIVVELPSQPERLASGMSAQVAVVERLDGALIRVPADNLLMIDSAH